MIAPRTWLTCFNRRLGCRLLVTSRQALDLYEEWVFPLQGLAYPRQSDTSDWDKYSALQLFYQQARRRNLHFSFENQREAVLRLCQVLEGWPLGIELAAAWVHVLSCQEILDRLLANLDLPASVFRNLPERQRSLRAVFQSSWDLLTSEERQALARSSLFEGGFTLLAAERVTGCNARTMASLVSKSLLRLRSDGRYEMHSLLRAFAGELLDEVESGRVAPRPRPLLRSFAFSLTRPVSLARAKVKRSNRSRSKSTICARPGVG